MWPKSIIYSIPVHRSRIQWIKLFTFIQSMICSPFGLSLDHHLLSLSSSIFDICDHHSRYSMFCALTLF